MLLLIVGRTLHLDEALYMQEGTQPDFMAGAAKDASSTRTSVFTEMSGLGHKPLRKRTNRELMGCVY